MKRRGFVLLVVLVAVMLAVLAATRLAWSAGSERAGRAGAVRAMEQRTAARSAVAALQSILGDQRERVLRGRAPQLLPRHQLHPCRDRRLPSVPQRRRLPLLRLNQHQHLRRPCVLPFRHPRRSPPDFRTRQRVDHRKKLHHWIRCKI